MVFGCVDGHILPFSRVEIFGQNYTHLQVDKRKGVEDLKRKLLFMFVHFHLFDFFSETEDSLSDVPYMVLKVTDLSLKMATPCD